MTWENKKLYWAWREDRTKDKSGNYIGEIPPTPTKKIIDYVTIGVQHQKLRDDLPNVSNNCTQKLAIGVWDDKVYTPLYRSELEFRLNTFVFDKVPVNNRPYHGVLVKVN